MLDHAPDHADITAFLRRFRGPAAARPGVAGVTTDGSPLYPEPLRPVFGDVPHQICEFHLIRELTKAILRAVAQVRKHLAAHSHPPRGVRPRGRPSALPATGSGCNRRLGTSLRSAIICSARLTPAERQTLHHITRGLPQLRTLRAIMEEVYRLFDRRCRTDTALAKLAQLRQRVRRYKHVGSILNKLAPPLGQGADVSR